MSRGCRYAEGDVVAEFWYSPVVDHQWYRMDVCLSTELSALCHDRERFLLCGQLRMMVYG